MTSKLNFDHHSRKIVLQNAKTSDSKVFKSVEKISLYFLRIKS